MPWNCLCSSKSKNRRPQISAPILSTEDTQKLQLIPLQRPLINSKHLHEKLIQPENDAVVVSKSVYNNSGANAPSVDIDGIHETANETEKSLQASQSPIDLAKSQSTCDSEPLVEDTTIASGKSMKKDIKRTKRLEKKRLKQQKKQLQKLNKKLKKQKNNENNNKKNKNR